VCRERDPHPSTNEVVAAVLANNPVKSPCNQKMMYSLLSGHQNNCVACCRLKIKEQAEELCALERCVTKWQKKAETLEHRNHVLETAFRDNFDRTHDEENDETNSLEEFV
jgi:hypothetical protein